MDIYTLYEKLLDAWVQCPIDEQEPIESAIRAVRAEMEDAPQENIILERELKRYRGFCEDQNDFDNLLSLLKIADRMDITINMEIDLEDIDLDALIERLRNNGDLKFKQYNEFKKAENALKCMWINMLNEHQDEDVVLSRNGLRLSDITSVIPYFKIDCF